MSYVLYAAIYAIVAVTIGFVAGVVKSKAILKTARQERAEALAFWERSIELNRESQVNFRAASAFFEGAQALKRTPVPDEDFHYVDYDEN